MSLRRPAGDRAEVLIAEDSPTQAARLAHILELHGYGVTIAQNGRVALQHLEHHSTSLIITDVIMPEMDGYSLCKAVKSDERWKHIPVMLVTTLSDPVDVVRGLECGADNFIRKPYEDRYIVSRVKYLLMNVELRSNQRMQLGVEMNLGGQRHFITSDRQQILDLLISTYEQAMQINSDLSQRESELERSNRMLTGMYQLVEKLNKHSSERELLEGVLASAMDISGALAGWILLRDEDSSFRLGPQCAVSFEGQLMRNRQCACIRKANEGLNSAADLECDWLRLMPAHADAPFHTTVPLRMGDEILGMINLVIPPTGELEDQLIKALGNLGEQVAVGLDRTRLRENLHALVAQRTAELEREVAERRRISEELSRQTERDAALADIGRIAVTSTESHIVVDEACRLVADILHVQAVSIVERIGGSAVRVIAARGLPGTTIGLVVPIDGNSQSAYTMAAGSHVIVTDYQSEKRFVPDPIVFEQGLRSGVSAVLKGAHGVLGAIHATSTDRREFSDSEVHFLEAMAYMISAAIESKLIEADLKRNQSLLNMATRLGRMGAWEVDLSTMTGMWSDEVCAIHEVPAGYVPSLEEAINFVAPEFREKIDEVVGRCAREGIPFDEEVQIITATGKRVWVRAIGEAERDASGAIPRIHGAFQDIAVSKEAAEETWSLAQRLTTTLESITDAFFTMDRDWRFAYLNPRAEQVLQRSREELEGRVVWDVFPAASEFEQQYRRSIADDRPVDFEAFYAPLNAWFEVHAYPSTSGLAVYFRDITAQRHARDQIAEQAAFLDQARDAIVVRALDQEILFWNKGAERIYGWTAEEALGRSFNRLLNVENQPLGEAEAAAIRFGEWSGEIQKHNSAGEALTVESHLTLLRDDAGRPKSILSIDTDITARKKLEQQFFRAQRLESIGTLAGGIAHDLNNLLMPITMGVELLKRGESDPKRSAVIANVERSARRGADLVKQVLSFARGVEGSRVPLHLDEIVSEIQGIAANTFPKNVSFEADIASDLRMVVGDPTQINQILMNLSVNARDAMPHGGRLSITAANADVDEQYAAMNRGLLPGHYVVIRVADTGIGMSPEVIDRIFEPFFTTKEIGQGTGLGLSTVIGIVRSHGGSVDVYSEVGKGTVFKVYLPALAEHEAVASASSDSKRLPRGAGELIMVVDDEASILSITQQTLEAFGYRVVTAEDGAQAIGLFALRRSEVDVVLTDLMMPVMDGAALIAALTRIDPDVRIIASSGLQPNGSVSRAAHSGVRHFLAKPYTIEVMLDTIHAVLHEGYEDRG